MRKRRRKVKHLSSNFITRAKFEALTEEQLNSLYYFNPCITSNPNILRVGQVWDDDGGGWRDAYESDR